MTDVFLNQGNVENDRMKEPFALHAHTSRTAIGATMQLSGLHCVTCMTHAMFEVTLSDVLLERWS